MNIELFLLLSIFIMGAIATGTVFAVDSSNWTSENVGNVEFKIPPQYQGGEVENYSNGHNSYILDSLSNFAIIDLSDYESLSNYYGDDVTQSNTIYVLNKEIDNRPIVLIYQEFHYYNDTSPEMHIYFPTNNTIYLISYNGTELTPEIKEIISQTPKSNIGSDEFYATLNHTKELAIEEYESKGYYPSEDTSEDRYYFLWF